MELTSQQVQDWRVDHPDATSFEFPGDITSIGKAAFSCSSGLKKIKIPEEVISICNFLFDGCRSLKTIVIPEGITSIGFQAFEDCISLETIVIPYSVASIGGGVFSSCSQLRLIIAPDHLYVQLSSEYVDKTIIGLPQAIKEGKLDDHLVTKTIDHHQDNFTYAP